MNQKSAERVVASWFLVQPDPQPVGLWRVGKDCHHHHFGSALLPVVVEKPGDEMQMALGYFGSGVCYYYLDYCWQSIEGFGNVRLYHELALGPGSFEPQVQNQRVGGQASGHDDFPDSLNGLLEMVGPGKSAVTVEEHRRGFAGH